MNESQSEAFGRAVGAEIRYWRTARSLTQAQLAKRLGLGVNTIRRYESGETRPDTAETWRIADALDVSISNLIERAQSAMEADIITVDGEPLD